MSSTTRIQKRPAAGASRGEIAGIEALIRKKMKHLRLICGLDARWSQGVRSGAFPSDKRMAAEIQAYYVSWMKGTDDLLRSIHAAGARGWRVSGAGEFLDAVGFSPAGIDPGATAAAFEKLEQGEGIPLSEAVHGGIRRRRAS